MDEQRLIDLACSGDVRALLTLTRQARRKGNEDLLDWCHVLLEERERDLQAVVQEINRGRRKGSGVLAHTYRFNHTPGNALIDALNRAAGLASSGPYTPPTPSASRDE